MENSPVTPTSVVASRVRELRKARQWTAQQLADALADVGIDWNRGLISKFETGSREGVSVAEVLALACVFDVSPLALLLPSESAGYAITPKRVADGTDRVIDWMLGRSGLPFGEQGPSLGWFGIPAGLPESLVRREIQFAADRDRELNALRVRNAELETQATVRSPQTMPDELLSLLGRAERSAQEAERRAETAEHALARRDALIRKLQQELPDELREQFGGLLTKLYMELQAQSSNSE